MIHVLTVSLAFLFSGQSAFAQLGSTCTNSIGGNNSGALTNNCPTYNFGPPPLPDGIYQNGQLIGRVGGAQYDGTSTTMTITDLRISSGIVDLHAPMKIQNVAFLCDALKNAQGGAVMTIFFLQGATTCNVIKSN